MFPVKYGESFLEEVVVKVIQKTALGVPERFAIDVESIGMGRSHIHHFIFECGQ